MKNKWCKICEKIKPLEDFYFNASLASYFYCCKSCHAELLTNRRVKSKLKVINYYSNGNNICACCGESEITFLSIDHINGDGAQHRVMNIGGSFYSLLINNNFPDLKLRVLCMNCNFATRKGKPCPHQLYKREVENSLGI